MKATINIKKTIQLNLVAVILLSGSVYAKIITIPNEYTTIQQGIDTANVGDTILVSPGTYIENINFSGKNIVVGSLFLTTDDTSYISQTIIDGNNSGNVVTFENGEDSTAIITGFTLKHGSFAYGGGIRCINSSPTIDNNIIHSNIVTVDIGGGIYCENSSPIITRNYITNNGGGPYSIFAGGIVCKGGEPYIAYNLIERNYVYVFSPGIYLINSTATIINNTIGYNGVINHVGIVCRDSSTANVSNTIIWGHLQSISYDSNSTVNITYSNIEGGWTGTGNIDQYPDFADTNNFDYNLQPNSPCINSGDPNSPNDPDGSRADMGALSFDQNVGINDHDFANAQDNIKIFPNPFSASTIIEFDNKNKGKHTLTIYNSTGALVRKIDNITTGQIIIERENLSSGLYFFQIMNNAERVGAGKIIVE